MLGLVTILLLHRVISGPDPREGFVVFENLSPYTLYDYSIEVERPVYVDITAQGSFERPSSDLATQVWIVDEGHHSVVWSMQESTHLVQKGRNLARVEERIQLKPGTYSIYYATYGNTQRGGKYDQYQEYDDAWKRASDEWYLVVDLDEGKSADVKIVRERSNANIAARLADERIIWNSGRLGSRQHEEAILEVLDDVRVHITAVGELVDSKYDYSRIENIDSGEVVWEMNESNTVYAGGVASNKLYNDEVRLERGMYRFVSQTDESHSFDDWDGNPPFFPRLWGATLSVKNGDTSSIRLFDPWSIGHPSAAIMPVESKELISKEFTLRSPQRMIVFGLGEMSEDDRLDYGWIEATNRNRFREIGEWDEDRTPDDDNTVWEMRYENSSHAGGDLSNRQVISFVDLPAGSYRLF